MTNKEIRSLINYSILIHSYDEKIEDAKINVYILKYPLYSWAHGFLWNNKERFTLFEAIIALLTKNTEAGQKRIKSCEDEIAFLTNTRNEWELLCWKYVKEEKKND